MQTAKEQKPISLAQHTVPLWAPPEMIRHAAAIGYDAVSIRSVPQGVAGEAVFPLSDPAVYRAAKEAMDETGIRINDIDLVAIGDHTQIAPLAREFEAAAKLGVSGVVASIWTPERGFYTDAFGRLAELAKGFGLAVHLEFVTWAEIRTVTEANALLDSIGAENAHILLDMIHFYRSRCTIQDLAACKKERFSLVHLCDAPAAIPDTRDQLISTCRKERLYPGEGAIPIEAILSELTAAEVFSVEIPNAVRTEELGAFGHAARAYETVKQLVL